VIRRKTDITDMLLGQLGGTSKTNERNPVAQAKPSPGRAPRILKEKVTELVDQHRLEKKRKRSKGWPACPSCGLDDGWFVWGGNVDLTTYVCGACGSKTNALEVGFDPVTISVLASPIVQRC